MENGTGKSKAVLWNKPFLVIILVNFLMFSSMYLLLPTLPIYAQKIGGSKTVAGLIVGLFTFSSLLTRPVSGNLADRIGRKKVLLAGIGVFLLSAMAYNWASVVILLFLWRVVHGIGWGAATTAAGTIASDVIPASRRGEGMGYYGISTTIAMSVGPAVGLYIVKAHSFGLLFGLSAIIAAAGLAAAILIHYEGIEGPLKAAAGKDGSWKSEVKGVIVEKTAVPPSLVLFFTALTYGGIVAFLPSYAESRGVEDIGMFFTVYALVLLAGRPFLGRLADKWGAGKVLVPGLLAVAASLLTLMAAKTLPLFLAAAVLYGLGFGAVQPVLSAVTITLAPVERRGAANATLFSSMDLGIGLGATILGVVSQHLGFSAMYGVSVLFAAIAMVVYFGVLRSKLTGSE